jgi:hypothetical protein
MKSFCLLGVSDRGEPLDSRTCSYADIDTSGVSGGADHRIYEGEEFDMDRAESLTQDTKFSGSQILGAFVSIVSLPSGD